MRYYFDKTKGRIAHLWNDTDTFCGFLKVNEGSGRQVQTNKRERVLCHVCELKWQLWNRE